MAIYRNGFTNEISRFMAEAADNRAAAKFIEAHKPKPVRALAAATTPAKRLAKVAKRATS